MAEPTTARDIATTGIAGLDDVLAGGLTRNRIYLVQGDPGAGKTTIGLHFLLDGLRRGETVLYVGLSETREEIEAVARSHGWTLDGVNIFEYSDGDRLEDASESTLFHPSELELGEATRKISKVVDDLKPQRVVIDSLSELRLLAQNPLRYRRQILALKQYFAGSNCTVLLLDDKNAGSEDMQLMTLAHGVILLEQHASAYGAERRRLRVSKFRGLKYRGGYHDFAIRSGGIEVFPRLIAAEHHKTAERQRIASGIEAIDALLGGGIDRGTSTLIIGPAGSGKSTLSTQYAIAAAERGEYAAIFIFDESAATMFSRSESISLSLKKHVDSGHIIVQQIDPAELAPGEFVQLVRDAVEKQHVSVVVIDSLNGYENAMPEERYLTIQLHEMLTYLGQQGVATILVVAQHGMLMGNAGSTPVDVSYLADCVILLRYFELAGEIRKAISVVKKRSGAHERSIRQLTISVEGLSVGPPLTEFHGVLSGMPFLETNISTITGPGQGESKSRARK